MTLTHLKIDCIRYDSAAEFAKSATFKAFCVNNRISMEETAAYTHTFKVGAEGAVRIVKESSGMVVTPCSRVAFVRVSAKLADASVLDESEIQVFVVVVRVTERTISRSLEGSHED